ncbi:MAG: alkaline phosphatase PhoX [Nitrospirales bacterium]
MMKIMVFKSFLVFMPLLLLSCSLEVKDVVKHDSLGFIPLSQSATTGSLPPCAPVALPEGYAQSILIQEWSQCSDARVTLDAVAEMSDRTDMNTMNETEAMPGRYLYRTHETNEGRAAISVIDRETGQTAIHTGEAFGGWNSFDGIEWTPWGTLLAAEEAGAYGRLFECQATGLHLTCQDRPAVGRMSHEGIAVASDGAVYVGDELDGGSIFKFVPENYGDLSSGQLFALNIINGGKTVCSGETGIGFTPTGAAEWVALTTGRNDVVTDPATNARAAAKEAGVTRFCRPEDAEIIDGNLYVATTTTRTVFQISIMNERPFVTEYAGINTNINNESDVPNYGLFSPDNLASDRAGNLYITEDNAGKSDIWMATPDKDQDGMADSVVLFATLTTKGAEASGIYFPPSAPRIMFLNVQHAENRNDMTLMISPIHD